MHPISNFIKMLVKRKRISDMLSVYMTFVNRSGHHGNVIMKGCSIFQKMYFCKLCLIQLKKLPTVPSN